MSDTQRILIVDDEPDVRLVFRTALESPGVAIAAAEDSETAPRWLETSTVDLVLLDLQVPGLGGMEVLRRLRDANSDVPVVIVMARGYVPNAVQAMKLGAIDFVSKPLTPEALRRVVDEVLRRHAARHAKRAAGAPEVVTTDSQYAADLARAKRVLNSGAFGEAKVFLVQASELKPEAPEAHNLLGILHECRNEHDASYREYRAASKADKHYEPARHNMLRDYERFTLGKSDVPIDMGER